MPPTPQRVSDAHVTASIPNAPRRDRRLTLEVGYRIDHLTAVMFAMVTFVATLIFIFSLGYMSDETEETVEDHEVDRQTPGRATTSAAAGASDASSCTCRCSASRC